MSKLEKLQVQGIRSFGPSDSNRQMMTFFSPLTLILGSNGTGKTTIIECLRNATTGDLPPGQGKVFIHDPKLNHESEVNAQIKLKFQDVTGNSHVLTKSFLLKQNKTNTTFKTVDTALIRYEKDGSRTAATPKCVDGSAAMIELMGVPRAIVESVIFCHQTESNWPLSEGQALKNKFDNIFAVTRYTKALELIRKLKIQYNSDVKMKNESIKYLYANKEKADEYEQDISKGERKLDEWLSALIEIEEKLEPLCTSLKELQVKEGQAHTVQSRLAAEEDQLQYTGDEIQRIKQNLKEIYTGSTDSLKRDIENFESHMRGDKLSLEMQRKELGKLTAQMDSLANEHKRLLPELGQLESEKNTVEESSQNVECKCSNLNQKHALGVLLYHEDPLEKKVKCVMSELDKQVMQAQLRLDGTKEDREQREKACQDDVDVVREQKSKCEQKLESTEKQIADKRREILKIRKELVQAEGYCSKIRNHEREISKFHSELDILESDVPCSQLKEKIASNQKSKNEMAATLEHLNKELENAQRFSKEQSELEHLQQELDEKTVSLNTTKTELKAKFEEILGTIPTSNYAKQLKQKINSIGSEVDALRDSTNRLKASESAMKTELKMLNDDLHKKESDLERSRRKVTSVCGSEDLDASILQLDQEVTKMRDEKGFIMGSQFMFRKYIARMRQSPCCPLCKRGFDELAMVERLVCELEKKISILPEELDKKTRDISEREQKHNDMQRLKGEEEKMLKLRNVDIPELKAKIKKVTADLEASISTRVTKEEQLEMTLYDQAVACSTMREAEVIDRLTDEIGALHRQIASKSPSVRRLEPGRTMEVVVAEITSLSGRVKQLDSQMLDYRSKLDQYHNLSMSLNHAKSAKLELESKMKEESHLREQMTKLESETRDLQGMLGLLVKEKGELQKQLDKAVHFKKKTASETEHVLEKLRLELNQLSLERDDLKRHFDRVQEYYQSSNPQRLQDIKKKLEDLNRDTEHLQSEKEEKAASIDILEKRLSRQELRERELKDNLRLHDLKVRVGEYKRKIEEIKDEMRSSGLANLETEKKKVEEKIRKLASEKCFAESKKSELKVKIDGARRELSGHFKDAKKMYMTALCEKSVKEFISKDLDMYYRATDFAVLRYHEQKMKDVNKAIKELWQDTYSGDDIDYIQIRTDTDDKGLEGAKRTYNYRVVMVKGRVEQDMRGRCSAGQKVLACLIIRLALSETFSQNCGIIALDEPTTNLDRNNIKGLALSLAKIVQLRKCQRNFQMVVITHDEEFLRLLNERNCLAEYYYRVEKDDMGYSRLVKHALSSIM